MYNNRCPWCRRDGDLSLTCEKVKLSDGTLFYYVWCRGCECCGPDTAKTEEEAWELFWRPFYWAEQSGRAQALNEYGILEPPNDVDDDDPIPLL